MQTFLTTRLFLGSEPLLLQPRHLYTLRRAVEGLAVRLAPLIEVMQSVRCFVRR